MLLEMKPSRLFLATLSLCLSAICLPQDNHAAVREVVNAHIKENAVAGASVAIMVDGRLRFAEGFGFQDLENMVPATSHTVYRLASISKVVTTVGLMQLVEQGKIDLDADARTYAPSFPAKNHVFTTRNLLTHTSGIRHYVTGKADNGTTQYSSTESALPLFRDDPLLYEPGTQSSYSTHAFTLVARINEGASGESFETYMLENVFKKAGTPLLAFEHREQTNQYRSKLYQKGLRNSVRQARTAQENSWKFAGGGMESSAIDLVRFAQAVIDGTLLNKGTVDEMWRKQSIGDLNLNRGLGWAIDGAGNPQHGGSQQGSRTYLTIYREQNTIIAVLTNTSGHDVNALRTKIAEAWFGALVNSNKWTGSTHRESPAIGSRGR